MKGTPALAAGLMLLAGPALADDCEALRRLIVARIDATRGTSETDDPRIREALAELARMRAVGAERARAAAAALASPDAGIRHAAVLTLGGMGEPAHPHLVAALADTEPFVVAGALEGLARGGPEAALDHARRFAGDPRDIVRAAAARILVRLDPDLQNAELPPQASEVHALRVLDAARRRDPAAVRAALHPVRRIEVVEEARVRGFLLATTSEAAVARDVVPALRRASESLDSLRCGIPDAHGGVVCAVTDRIGYSTELHFARLLNRLYLFRVRHHGGVPQI